MLAILLPPSEGKAPGGSGGGWEPDSGRFGPVLGAHRERVVAALSRTGGGSAKLLGLKSGPALERARAANTNLLGAATLPAWKRFTGVVWDHLDPGSDAPAARRRAARRVIIVSALTGLSALDDPVPDFRLKLSVSLRPLGRMSTFWKPRLSTTLNDHLAGRFVVDLLPQEHRAAWEPASDRYDYRRVSLIRPDGGNAGHFAKAGKGILARALLESEDPERTLASWHHPGLSVRVDPSPAP